MISDSGAVKVLDFGLARTVTAAHSWPVAANTSEGGSAQPEARDVGAASLGHVEEVSGFHTIGA